MAKNNAHNNKQADAELKQNARAFADAFMSSHARNNSFSDFADGSGISMGAAGVVELDLPVEEALSKLLSRAEQLLGPAAAHRRAFYDIALASAHEAVINGLTQDAAGVAVISKLWDEGLKTYEWVSPNRLLRFNQGIDQIKIGRVRAMPTNTLIGERATQFPNHPVSIIVSNDSGFHVSGDGTFAINLYHTCWLVEVDAIIQHVETEGKWLIDVAVSYLRLRHNPWSQHVPTTGGIEPHPTKATPHHNEGAKIDGPKVIAGGGKMPPWYDIDPDVLVSTQSKKFIDDANVIFSAPAKSVAERVAQGLGWLTRGRQSEDRSERLLYFFTAIEALLSSDDKTAPITQTIARHAAVMLSNDNAKRAEIAAQIKKLYQFRSALVHAGARSVSGSIADQTQSIAESLYYVALEKADLKTSHSSFCKTLADASYGQKWPI